jgi:transcriptional regulator with XRE-family HTH domain
MSKTTIMVLYQMPFSTRLATIRKQRGFTQETLADTVGITKTQVYRYENGTSQPTLEVIKKLALALSVSTDALIFEDDERQPDDSMLLLMESVSKLDPDEKHLIKEMIEGVLLKHQAKKIMSAPKEQT